MDVPKYIGGLDKWQSFPQQKIVHACIPGYAVGGFNTNNLE